MDYLGLRWESRSGGTSVVGCNQTDHNYFAMFFFLETLFMRTVRFVKKVYYKDCVVRKIKFPAVDFIMSRIVCSIPSFLCVFVVT